MGKTTIAVGLSGEGMAFGRTTRWLSGAASGFTALRLPFEPNLRERSAPTSNPRARRRRSEGPTSPEWTRAPLGAFCVLERLEYGPESQLARASPPSDGFVSLLAQSYRFKPQARSQAANDGRLSRDLSQLPFFAFVTGPASRHLSGVIDQLEEALLGSVASAASCGKIGALRVGNPRPLGHLVGPPMLAWSAVLPILKHVVPLRVLTRLMSRAEARADPRPRRRAQVAFLARRIYRVRPFQRARQLPRIAASFSIDSCRGRDWLRASCSALRSRTA